MTPRLQEQFGYAYDKAWNLNQRINNAMVETFNVNGVNELSTIGRSGTLTVAGTATEPGSKITSVTLSGTGLSSGAATVYGDGTWARAGAMPADGWNSYTAIAQDNVWPNGRRDTNTVTAYLPASASYTYDLNGNLLSDGRRNFAYDDENQLISVWVANGWSNSFAYDGLLRKRIEKDYAWNGSTWIETNEVHFIYDGYLVLQERYYDPQHPTDIPLDSITYTRGVDLSGTLQGAGGIGGLLARTDMGQWIAGTPWATAYYFADAQGNVDALVYTNGLMAAEYEYDPYGNIVSMSGPLAGANKYRFSSKEWNDNASLYYYGFRFYDPNLQRWVNRDLITELGFLSLWGLRVEFPVWRANLYEFVENAPNYSIDPFGLIAFFMPCSEEEMARCKAAGFDGCTHVEDHYTSGDAWVINIFTVCFHKNPPPPPQKPPCPPPRPPFWPPNLNRNNPPPLPPPPPPPMRIPPFQIPPWWNT